MTRSIWKFPLKITITQRVEFPADHRFLSLQVQDGVPTWQPARTEGAAPACKDCDEAARQAYSDATTPGFFFPKCAKHREAVTGAAPSAQVWFAVNSAVGNRFEDWTRQVPQMLEAYATERESRLREELKEKSRQLDMWVETYGKLGVELVGDGWQLAHDPASCGHPRACWLDRNYPHSEKNYNPETHSGEPPIDYRCIMCESEKEVARLREELRQLRALSDSVERALTKPEPPKEGM